MHIYFGISEACTGAEIITPDLAGIARHGLLQHIVPSAGTVQLAGIGAPAAGKDSFFGLGASTVTMPRAEGFMLGFVGPLRALLPGGGAVWSIGLARRIAGLAPAGVLRRYAATVCAGLAASAGPASGAIYFWVWQ